MCVLLFVDLQNSQRGEGSITVCWSFELFWQDLDFLGTLNESARIILSCKQYLRSAWSQLEVNFFKPGSVHRLREVFGKSTAETVLGSAQSILKQTAGCKSVYGELNKFAVYCLLNMYAIFSEVTHRVVK